VHLLGNGGNYRLGGVLRASLGILQKRFEVAVCRACDYHDAALSGCGNVRPRIVSLNQGRTLEG